MSNKEIALSYLKKGLSVRQTEMLVKNITSRPHKKKHATKDHHILSLEEELQHLFGTRVNIVSGKKRGRVEIQYYSGADLERILKILRNKNA